MKTESEIREYLNEIRHQLQEFEGTFNEGDLEEGLIKGLIEGLEFVLNEGENQ